MLPSTGLFKAINCPFYDADTCLRPFCHFRHTKKGNLSQLIVLFHRLMKMSNFSDSQIANRRNSKSKQPFTMQRQLTKLDNQKYKFLNRPWCTNPHQRIYWPHHRRRRTVHPLRKPNWNMYQSPEAIRRALLHMSHQHPHPVTLNSRPRKMVGIICRTSLKPNHRHIAIAHQLQHTYPQKLIDQPVRMLCL